MGKATKTKREYNKSLEKFGKFLMRQREKKKLTQEMLTSELGKVLSTRKIKTGVSLGRIAHYEQGRVVDPDPEVLRAFADVFEFDFLTLVMVLGSEKYTASASVEERLRWMLLENVAAGSMHDDWREIRGKIAAIGYAQYERLLDQPGKFVINSKEIIETDFLDIQGIAEWQKTIEGLKEFWVVAPDFLDDENNNLRQAVCANIGKNVRYIYLIKNGDQSRIEFLRNQIKVDLAKSPKPSLKKMVTKVNKLVVAFKLSPEAELWLHSDIMIANATSLELATGFQSVRRQGRTALGIRVEKDELRRIANALKKYLNSRESRFEYGEDYSEWPIHEASNLEREVESGRSSE